QGLRSPPPRALPMTWFRRGRFRRRRPMGTFAGRRRQPGLRSARQRGVGGTGSQTMRGSRRVGVYGWIVHARSWSAWTLVSVRVEREAVSDLGRLGNRREVVEEVGIALRELRHRAGLEDLAH